MTAPFAVQDQLRSTHGRHGMQRQAWQAETDAMRQHISALEKRASEMAAEEVGGEAERVVPVELQRQLLGVRSYHNDLVRNETMPLSAVPLLFVALRRCLSLRSV